MVENNLERYVMNEIKSRKLKTGSVLVVALMLVAGMGCVLQDGDESTAASSQTPLGQLNTDCEALYSAAENGNRTYYLGYGSLVDIKQFVEEGVVEYMISAVTSTYDDYAGLTFASTFGELHGSINKGTGGTLQLTLEMETNDGSTFETVYLNIIDMTSTAVAPWTSLSLPAGVFMDYGESELNGVIYYLMVGSTVNIVSDTTHIGSSFMEYNVDSVTPGYGLSVSAQNLTGTVNKTGTITVVIEYNEGFNSETSNVTIEVVNPNHADIRMIGGETWTYSPDTNLSSIVSISGTATSWISVSSNIVSGTAPTNTTIGQSYDLTITATATNPSQTIVQTVSFIVDPAITVTASASTQTIQYGSGTLDIISSNYEGGSRSIYSITGASGYNIDAASGVISYSAPSSGSVTITATSPYTYSSGATNSASTTVNINVQGQLTASVSGTLYLVTGKTVPNTSAENVTLSHNNVGSGTYTWSIIGANNSGVTVSSSGTLGGTPGPVGNYAVTVRCTSVVGGLTQTADATLNVVIVPVLVFTTSPSFGTFS